MQAEQREHQEQYAKHGDGTGFLLGFFVDPFKAENRWKSHTRYGQQKCVERLGPRKKGWES